MNCLFYHEFWCCLTLFNGVNFILSILCCCCYYTTPSEGWGQGGRPWNPKSKATPQGLDQQDCRETKSCQRTSGAKSNCRLNVMMRSLTPFELGRNGSWLSRESQLSQALSCLFYRFRRFCAKSFWQRSFLRTRIVRDFVSS